MYKLILCMRYLRTRYLAFVCIVSVMLGVATLIVVNSVMSGFSNKLRDRLHGVLSDVILDTDNFAGFREPPDEIAKRILASPAGPHIEVMAPTVEVVATIQFQFRGMNVVKPVKLTGVNADVQSKVGGFGQFISGQKHLAVPSFDLSPEALRRFARNIEENTGFDEMMRDKAALEAEKPSESDFLGQGPRIQAPLDVPVNIPAPDLPQFEAPKPIGIFVGHSLAHFRYKNPETGLTEEIAALKPGDSVLVATLAADEMRPVWGTFVVADYFKSDMSEYDSQFVYMSLADLQRLRRMGDRVSHLQIKLKDTTPKSFTFVKANVTDEIQKLFRPYEVRAATWEEHQGPLLAAIDVERGILNLLLFLIVGVAGFSILAIFTMIVSEKIRDIGIMKSLGASSHGVMGIFVWYAVLLGFVGCTLGTVLGLGITYNINAIEKGITVITGAELFPRDIYYFDKIPTNVESLTVILVNIGAMSIAIASSLIPAYRAARLRPIQALRFE